MADFTEIAAAVDEAYTGVAGRRRTRVKALDRYREMIADQMADLAEDDSFARPSAPSSSSTGGPARNGQRPAGASRCLPQRLDPAGLADLARGRGPAPVAPGPALRRHDIECVHLPRTSRGRPWRLTRTRELSAEEAREAAEAGANDGA